MRIRYSLLVVCLLAGCELFAQQYPTAGYPLPVTPLEHPPGTSPAQAQPPNLHVAMNGQAGTIPGEQPPVGPAVAGPGVAAWDPNLPQPAFPAEQPPTLPLLPGSMSYVGPVAPAKPAEPPPKIWEGNLEFGLDGTEGNSQNLNYHVGGKLKRKTKANTLSTEIDYHHGSSDWQETVNNGMQEARAEHNFGESAWTCFLHDMVNYNEFKEYHLRVGVDAGFGYQFLKTEATSLIGRFGAGTSREFAGPTETDFVPEMVFGVEGEHKLGKWQKLTSSLEYRPDVGNFDNYRVTAKAGWEILLDEENHLSFKLAVRDLYDSNAGSKRPNDLDYNAALLWSF